MPVYAYVCEECEAEFEAFASIHKKESGWQPVCPKCGSEKTRQIFKPISMIGGSHPSTASGSGCCSLPRRITSE